MSLLKDKFMQSKTYNGLPFIHEVADIPKVHRKDLDDLRGLLQKHNVPEVVCVRLIHKHFDALDDEVMVLRAIPVSPHGIIQIMGPMMPQSATSLRGLNYIVNDDGELEAYEYTTAEGPDMSNYSEFLKEFSHIIVERGLQRKWGLKVGLAEDKGGWTEFEFPDKRSTLTIPQGIPLPPFQYDFSVTTDWHVEGGPITRCWHCNHCNHCGHCNHGGWWTVPSSTGSEESDLYFAGEKLESGSPIHTVVRTAIMAM